MSTSSNDLPPTDLPEIKQEQNERSGSRLQSTLSRLSTNPLSRRATRFSHPEAGEKTADNVIVGFEGPDDPYCALNWSTGKKVRTTLCFSSMTACTSFSTAIFASATIPIAEEFHVGETTATLGTTLFLLGVGIGPLLWAPLSELYGRRAAVIPPFFIGACFTLGTATAKDIQTIMITRFFAAFFASGALVNTGGVLADLFSARDRALAMSGYQLSILGAPVMAPIIGAAITQSGLTWRWMPYITSIMMMTIVFINLFVEETNPNTRLVYKARTLRYETGNWALHAKHEEWNPSIGQMATKYLVRPFQMLATPICFVMTLYLSFMYTITYICLTSYALIFQTERGWSELVASLPILALLVGSILGIVTAMSFSPMYRRRLEANNRRPVPEARLFPMMLGGPCLTIGLFLLAWTAKKSVSAVVPIIASVILGFSAILLFQSGLNYIVDTFQMYAASALAANTVVRSIMAGSFPLFIRSMFDTLGIDWALSLLGFFSMILLPATYIFYVFGRRIRARGKWSKASTM